MYIHRSNYRKVRHPEHRLRQIGRAVKPSIEDGVGDLVGMKRTYLWDWHKCINKLQPIPDHFIGRVVVLVLVLPLPVVDPVVYLWCLP